jgi:sulfotransferase family protein
MEASAELERANHRAGTRVPEFFIVGHPKSGTTALYDMLRRHPEIFMPADKEPWFLASELNIPTPRPPRQGRTPKTLEEYLSLFDAAGPGQRVGEASALYLWSQTAAGRIAELQPNARIVAVLREPASFLRSLHMQFLQNYTETEKDFGKALALEDARRAGEQLPPDTYWPRAVLYSEHVRYVEQLRRYETIFPPEQMLVLIYDDYRADNLGTLRRVLRFLEVDESAPVAVRDVNPSVRVRSPRLYGLAHSLAVGKGPAARALNRTVRAITPRSLTGRSALAVRDRLLYADPDPPDEAVTLELRRRFRGEVEALSEHLDRDLVALWGYDALE